MIARLICVLCLFWGIPLSPLAADEKIAAVLADPALQLHRPAERAGAVARIRAIEDAKSAGTRTRARALGLKVRTEKADGTVREIVDFDDGRPVYLTTLNLNAAISTAANLLQSSPYQLDGSGLIVGIWDGGSVRGTHQEFAVGSGSRVTIRDGSAFNDHATHVGGTVAAAGASASRKGMAFNALVDSYYWDNDSSEMTSRAATGPDQFADKIYLSNHSYGFVDGWDGNEWRGTGTDQNAYDPNFGQYSTTARTHDGIIYSAPYYLSFWAAGNDGNDTPGTGSNVVIGGNTFTYNPSIHPPGDGVYRNGFETISGHGIAKNVLTIGAANDAVTSGTRDPSRGTLASFSSTGPTDDGRIKPDLVANGVGLSSTGSASDTTYNSKSGTSMASPNACGSAALVIDQYRRLFGGGMRASTLKGLLIHTATDLGNAGPDYRYGWGLVNVREAADLIIDHHADAAQGRLREDSLSTAITSRTYPLLWDGSSPLRATLCWTDPAGASTSAHDSRTPRLVNDLNLKLIAPDGSEHFPFVMPFVGDWSVASMGAPAVTGVNQTDNVEQVLITNPGQPGAWQVVVSHVGTLANGVQNFSLLLSGIPQETPGLTEIWSESFDAAVAGWSSEATAGTHNWVLSSARSHSPEFAYFGQSLASKVTSHLVSPAIPIPADALGAQLRFRHWYDLETGYDGGRLEFSINEGPWFGIDEDGSGASFAEEGYDAIISTDYSSDIGGLAAWTGASGGFVGTVVDLTDMARYAGTSLRVRWKLATDTSVTAEGWYVDSISFLAATDGSLPGSLVVTPPENFDAAGSAGGPFSPFSQAYVLSNPGDQPVDWSAAKAAAWLTLDATGGTLEAGGSVTVTLNLNAGADTLPGGTFSDTVAFTNTTNHAGDTTRTVLLNVNTPPFVSAGADQSVDLGPSTPWTPSAVSPLAWYDAADGDTVVESGGSVSTWNDKSGNNRHLSQAVVADQPSFSGGTVSFDGTSDHLWNDAPFIYQNGRADIFIIASIPGGQSDRRILAESSSTSNAPIYGIAQTNPTDPGRMGVFIRNDANASIPGHVQVSASGAFDGGTRIYHWRDTGTSLSGRVNGGIETASAYSRSGTMGVNRFALGALLRGSVSHPTRAEVREVVVSHNLSGPDRERMEGYLAHKWGNAADLPFSHPHKDAAPGQPTAVAALDGTAIDPDAGPLGIRWSIVSGPAPVAFDNPEAVDTSATFTMAGTYVLRLTADDGLTTVSSEITVVVNPPTPYASWAAGDFANPFDDTLQDANPDGDTFTNLIEFAFGTDPTVSGPLPVGWGGGPADAAGGKPVMVETALPAGGTGLGARFLRRKDHGEPGSVRYAWRFSSDLGDWESSDDNPAWLTAPNVLAEDASGNYELVEVAFPAVLSTLREVRFIQIVITPVP